MFYVHKILCKVKTISCLGVKTRLFFFSAFFLAFFTRFSGVFFREEVFFLSKNLRMSFFFRILEQN